jgi:hypothetical protein
MPPRGACSLVPIEWPPVVHPVVRVGVDPHPRRCPRRHLRPHLRRPRLSLRLVPRVRAQRRRDCIPFHGIRVSVRNVCVKVGAYFTNSSVASFYVVSLYWITLLCFPVLGMQISGVLRVSIDLAFGIENAESQKLSGLNMLGVLYNHSTELVPHHGSSRKGPKDR